MHYTRIKKKYEITVVRNVSIVCVICEKKKKPRIHLTNLF